MKPDTNSGRPGDTAAAKLPIRRTLGVRDGYAILFGIFLGLSLLKFGNPVILDDKVEQPASWSAAWADPWPPHWALLLMVPLAFAGAWVLVRGRPGAWPSWLWILPLVWLGGQILQASVAASRGETFTLWPPRQLIWLVLGLVLAVAYVWIGPLKPRWPGSRWLWVLPAVWYAWQIISAKQSVDGRLTTFALWEFGGCLACYIVGALLLGTERGVRLLLIGVLAGFAFCLVRGAVQWRFEFPQGRQMLVEGQRTGWAGFPPEVLLQMKQDGVIVSTNGVDVANPIILTKYEKRRVHGTLVYPNALAGAVLLCLPVSLVFAFKSTKDFRVLTRVFAIALTVFLGFGVLFWTGSKSGWLIAAGMAGVWLLSLKWRFAAKVALISVVAATSLVAFGIRFQSYFASGATSVGARFDYWRAAVQITQEHPAFGTGPGTFQRPYARLKAPESEMARLTHNDYLEQFCDSGIVGGLSYIAWIVLLLATIGRRVWQIKDALQLALFVGILGWFVQGFSEFSLYVPALAWTAFVIAGGLLGLTANEFDKAKAHG